MGRKIKILLSIIMLYLSHFVNYSVYPINNIKISIVSESEEKAVIIQITKV
jgi:hypothetical protein